MIHRATAKSTVTFWTNCICISIWKFAWCTSRNWQFALADCYAAAGPARCREALGEVFALPEDTDYLAIAPAVLTKLAARYGAVRVGFTGALTPEQLARYGKGTGVQGISAADAHGFLAALDADTFLSPRRSAAARAAVWDAFFRQALELLPTTLPQGLREVSSSLLTSLTAVDLAAFQVL